MSRAITHIFLDMDGVLSDFISAAATVHGRPDALQNWPPGEWDAPTVLGISTAAFWNEIDQAGAAFWSRLDAYPWTAALIEITAQFAPFSILSSPSMHPECPTGKVTWLRAHLGSGFRDYLLGHQKHLCAKPGAVLIDDNDDNVAQFREHGGHAVLFPQPWNANHQIDDRLGYVAQELRRFVIAAESNFR